MGFSNREHQPGQVNLNGGTYRKNALLTVGKRTYEKSPPERNSGLFLPVKESEKANPPQSDRRGDLNEIGYKTDKKNGCLPLIVGGIGLIGSAAALFTIFSAKSERPLYK